jgi:heme-degrading monooxygenase HmoA
MYARVSIGEVTPEQLETFRRMIHDQVVPRARRLPGFKGGYWLADREGGQVIGITLFETEEALRASEESAARIREESSRTAGLKTPSFASYEVVESAGSAKEVAA